MAKTKTKGKKSSKTPTGNVDIIMYDVGFGDCYLLTFPYADGTVRRVLIDCGSLTEKSKAWAEQLMGLITEDCRPRKGAPAHLDALVITHRHLDHLGALQFKSTRQAMEALQPKVVILPWVEHPDVERGDTGPPVGVSRLALAQLASLDLAHSLAEAVTQNPAALSASVPSALRERVMSLAAYNVKNRDTIEWLNTLGAERCYAFTGADAKLAEVLPGVKVTVLGPPKADDQPEIMGRPAENSDQYWELRRSLAAALEKTGLAKPRADALFAGAPTIPIAEAAPVAAWVIKRLDDADVGNLLRIMEMLDDAVNNTSVILLFEVGGKLLLFSGDAQWENWQYVLEKKPGLAGDLPRVNLYKVGHHGSHNATPVKLWDQFTNRGDAKKPKRLVALLSTADVTSYPQVPRCSLLCALQKQSHLVTNYPPQERKDIRIPYELR